MGKWLKRTFDYGKKGKIVVTYDDGDPRKIQKVEFIDAAGTTSVFDRAAETMTITVKDKEPTNHKSLPGKHLKKQDKFVYVFDKDGWEFEIHDDGTIVWKRNVGKPDETTERVDTKGKDRGTWTRPSGVKLTPTPAHGTDEKIDAP